MSQALTQLHSIIPVLLCGGKGERLWPLSTPQTPKAFLSLAGADTLFEQTLQRVGNPALFVEPLVVGHRDHAALLKSHHANVLLEARAANTAAAIAVAVEYAVQQHDDDAVMMVCPCDHAIKDHNAFEHAITNAAPLAKSGKLVLLGATPDAADTNYGYIHKGAPLEGGFAVQRFTEKPDAATAQRWIETGSYLWNCGVFVFSLQATHRYLHQHHARLMKDAANCFDGVSRYEETLWLADGFATSTYRSFDHEVVENYSDLAVVEVAMGWSDVGSYQRLWEQSDRDEHGNAGNAITHCASNNLVQTQVPTALIGVENLVVAQNENGLLIADRAHADQIKSLIPLLSNHTLSVRTERPWGYFEQLFSAPNVQVKSLMIDVGKRLSLQRHQHRSEHWVVIAGVANVHKDGCDFTVHPNESIFVPMGCTHRLENAGDEPLLVIEVQTGAYLGEDDIERFADDFGRTEKVA